MVRPGTEFNSPLGLAITLVRENDPALSVGRESCRNFGSSPAICGEA